MADIALRKSFFSPGVERIAQTIGAISGEGIEQRLGVCVGEQYCQALRHSLLYLDDPAFVAPRRVRVDKLDVPPLRKGASGLSCEDVDQIVFGGPVEVRRFRPDVI